MADNVTVRDQFGREQRVPKDSAPYFVNQGFTVLDSAGRVNAKATKTAAATTDKDN